MSFNTHFQVFYKTITQGSADPNTRPEYFSFMCFVSILNTILKLYQSSINAFETSYTEYNCKSLCE